ncbi:TadE/TadG family type IV pilus assembly protein [Robbsia sp. KACC 23696]|uniref:TadE/TadG family type IV pilus assembly protein n=1 Tax=Robbsia sp. KACC 23696 TaxID=3149231 RepID=UPI00325C1286
MMRPIPTLRRTSVARVEARARRAGRASRFERGAAALELTIILPLALMLLLGFIDIYNYMRTQSTVEHTAFMLADSLSMMTQVFNDTGTTNSNALGSVWVAANLIAKPLALSTNGGVVITSVCDSATCTSTTADRTSVATGTPKIWWQASAPWNVSTSVTKETSSAILPSYWPFRSTDSALVVEVFYVYDPFPLVRGFWPSAPGKTTLYKRVYVRPRNNYPLPLKDKSLE